MSTGLAAPVTVPDAERRLAELLADLLSVEVAPVDAHFFAELGADSMTMARFCARVRKQPDLPSISMKEIYSNPTIESLTAALVVPAAAEPQPIEATLPGPARAGTAAYLLCGAVQAALVLVVMYAVTLLLIAGYSWVVAGSGAADLYLRIVAFGAVTLLALCVVPILAKWILVGRWRPTEIRVWSVAYVRFWFVKSLVRSNPLVLAVGSPLYTFYLRLLGARIGRGALILSRHVPICADLLTVGAGAVIRKDAFFTCYHAESGRIRTGTATIGDRAHVGEATVIGLDTMLGDDARLGHATSLQDGETVLVGDIHDVGRVEPMPSGRVRPVLYTLAQVAATVLVYLPLILGGAALLVAEIRQRTGLLTAGALSGAGTYVDALVVAAIGYVALLVVGLALLVTVPRLLHLSLRAGRTYPLYGMHYWAQRSIERFTNLPFFPRLLGDSSYIVPYLRAIGYDLSEVEQTGSNFGLEVKHENPYLCTVGTGTMVADGLSLINADYSGTSFRLSRTVIGERSFLGNYIAYPPQSTAGDNCLLATKVQIPTTGERRDDTGLLGSPSFEIPRTVRRDSRFDHLGTGAAQRTGLRAKNRHNLVSIALYVGVSVLLVAELLVLATAAVQLAPVWGAWAFALLAVLGIAVRVGHFTLAERASTLFRPLQPRYCSIYDRRFWQHERFWKIAQQPLILDGTPFKSLTWRLMGVRIGRRVFDDGCAIVEKTLTTIGDDCTLNVRSVVQAHSQEDGAFKADRIVIGSRCTLGTGSLVHYATTMGDDVVLAPDSFLMKGEEASAGTRWAGNPAREIR